MPTTRPRLTITETDEVAEALDEAAEHWPEAGSRRELLLRLVATGRETIADSKSDVVERRRQALEKSRGALTGAYGPEYLGSLRDDWPE